MTGENSGNKQSYLYQVLCVCDLHCRQYTYTHTHACDLHSRQRTYTHTHSWTNVCTHTQACRCTHTSMEMHTHAWTHVCTRTASTDSNLRSDLLLLLQDSHTDSHWVTWLDSMSLHSGMGCQPDRCWSAHSQCNRYQVSIHQGRWSYTLVGRKEWTMQLQWNTTWTLTTQVCKRQVWIRAQPEKEVQKNWVHCGSNFAVH